MATSTEESQSTDLTMDQSQSSAGKYTTSINVNNNAEPSSSAAPAGLKFESQGHHTAEIVTTPTDAAAAGAGGDTNPLAEAIPTNSTSDVVQVDIQDEPAGDMGNGTSGTSGAVTLTQIKTREENLPLKDLQSGSQKQSIDDVFPATSLTTTRSDGKVRLRMDDRGPGSIKPITIPTMVADTLKKGPDHLALAVKREGVWKKWTYSQYISQAKQAAKALIHLGLEPNNAVGILGFNSPEWFITYLGTIYAGGKATGIYTTNTADACKYVLKDCDANVVIVENNMQLQKILEVWDDLPTVKAIVQYTGEVAHRKDNIYSWEEFLNMSSKVPDSDLDHRLSLQAPNTCCSLIYTSGTTGPPKAVMISHDNCTWTPERTGDTLHYEFGKEVFVSFLPLSHIAAQMLDLLLPIRWGASVYFAQPDALKGTLGDTWREVHPTGVLAVPRVWEKIMERMLNLGKTTGGMKKKMATWAKKKGLEGSRAKQRGESLPWGWSIANVLVFKKLLAVLGLDRCKLFGSAAAPITKETLEYFSQFDIRIDECYGMSECTGPHTFCTNEFNRITSVGKEMPGVQTKIYKPDDDGNGEICYWGRHIFMGYMNQDEKTKEAVDEDGWLHSGDVGKHDKDHFLYITGRIKELLITAGGENIAPVAIEDNVKLALPCISNCMLIGDKRKFLSMLLTFKCEMNLDTAEPLENLTDAAQDWCKSVGSQASTVQQAIHDAAILKAIQTGIDKANKQAPSNAAKIQKWSILPKDFSLPGGELGPTLKLRRPIVVKKYDKTISAFYED